MCSIRAQPHVPEYGQTIGAMGSPPPPDPPGRKQVGARSETAQAKRGRGADARPAPRLDRSMIRMQLARKRLAGARKAIAGRAPGRQKTSGQTRNRRHDPSVLYGVDDGGVQRVAGVLHRVVCAAQGPEPVIPLRSALTATEFAP